MRRRDTKRIFHRITMDRYDCVSKRLIKRKGPQMPIGWQKYRGNTIKTRIDQARLKADLTITELELLAGEPGLYTNHVFSDAYMLGLCGGRKKAIEARKKRCSEAVRRIAKILNVPSSYLLKNT